MAVVGILHPGQMGVSVAASVKAAGNEVLWASDGRSPETRARAADAGLLDVGSISVLADRADIIISVAPPSSALDVAAATAATRFSGVFLDANAVSPATAHQVSDTMAFADAAALDGGIIGPPAWSEGTTRLYVAGSQANAVADALGGGPLDVIALDSPYGSASALKMAYAGWTKGSAALLLSIAAYASSAGVHEALVDEWNISQPGLATRTQGSAKGTGPKAWRFVGEMKEIAAAQAESGLPDGFHLAAADIYQRLAGFKDATPGPELNAVIESLNGPDEAAGPC